MLWCCARCARSTADSSAEATNGPAASENSTTQRHGCHPNDNQRAPASSCGLASRLAQRSLRIITRLMLLPPDLQSNLPLAVGHSPLSPASRTHRPLSAVASSLLLSRSAQTMSYNAPQQPYGPPMGQYGQYPPQPSYGYCPPQPMQQAPPVSSPLLLPRLLCLSLPSLEASSSFSVPQRTLTSLPRPRPSTVVLVVRAQLAGTLVEANPSRNRSSWRSPRRRAAVQARPPRAAGSAPVCAAAASAARARSAWIVSSSQARGDTSVTFLPAGPTLSID